MNPLFSAAPGEGIAIKTESGEPVFLALIDANGNIIDTGHDVGRIAYAAAVESFRNVLIGQGHLKVYKGPDDLL